MRAALAAALSCLAACLVLGLAVPVAAADGPVDPPSDPVAESTPAADYEQPPTRVQVLPERCVGDEAMPTTPRACQVVSAGRRAPIIVVWGDSHSWQQTPAIVRRAQATRSSLVTFQMGACPPMLLQPAEARNGCARLGPLALDYIRTKAQQGREVSVVLGGYWHGYRDLAAKVADGWVPPEEQAYLALQAERFAYAGPRAFRALDRLPVRTVGIAQMPTVGFEAPACEAGVAPYSCDLPRSHALPDEAALTTWLTRRVDRVVDATGYLCDATTCRPRTSDGRPVYLDSLHLNPAITAAFAPAFAAALR